MKNYFLYLQQNYCGKYLPIYNVFTTETKKYDIVFATEIGFELREKDKENKSVPYIARFAIAKDGNLIKRKKYNLLNKKEKQEFVTLLNNCYNNKFGYSFILVIRPSIDTFTIINSDFRYLEK